MSTDLQHVTYLSLAYLVLFGFAEWLYHAKQVKAETTRKVVHVFTGLLALLFPLLLTDHIWVALLCGSFLILLVLSLRFKFLPSINAVQRKTLGSIMYPLIVYGCFLLFSYYEDWVFYYLPILILAVCDPLAAMTGRRWPYGTFMVRKQKKTLMGSMSFFISAFILTVITMGPERTLSSKGIIITITISFLSALSEAVTVRGIDNFTIPLSVASSLVFFKQFALWI